VSRAQGPLVLSDEFRVDAIGYPAAAERYAWAKDPLEPFLQWAETNRLDRGLGRKVLATRARALLKRWTIEELLRVAPVSLGEMAERNPPAVDADGVGSFLLVDRGARAPAVRRTHRIADEYRAAARLLQEWLRLWIDLGYATLPRGGAR
jgi:hypothetical protein